MNTSNANSQHHWLVPVSGPALPVVELDAARATTIIGRHEQCDVRLPSESVSRRHARLAFAQAQWTLMDLNSRWGTFVNGVRLAPETTVSLRPGDLLQISPWTFRFSDDGQSRHAVDSVNDVDRMHTLIRTIPTEGGGGIAEKLLALLLETATTLHAASDEITLANVLLAAASRGSGMPNASFLRAANSQGGVDIVAALRGASGSVTFSRSLLTAAANGVVAGFSFDESQDVAHSIAAMKIDHALCVPLMLGQSVAAFLYLDARGSAMHMSASQWAGACAFCVALGRIASLALANLKRIEMERRAATLDAELAAAAEAQRWVLPSRSISAPPFACFGESRPGRHVGGDFFDIIPLPDGRLALALGDVCGKGIAASILMTTAQGFLNATLRAGGDLGAAVSSLNQFISPRLPAERFLTLWAGIIDPTLRSLQYIDAGHGYAFLISDDQSSQALRAGDNIPLGVSDAYQYSAATTALPASGHLLLISDGIVEQPARPDGGEEPCGDFGVDRAQAAAQQFISSPNPLTGLFEAVSRHAGSTSLADDATALIVRW